MSSYLGRLCAMQDEEWVQSASVVVNPKLTVRFLTTLSFDVEFPIECDDEYWDPSDPDHPFKQPPGKPSLITGFNCSLKLCEILAYMLRTLYSTKKSKVLRGLIGDQWEQRIVSELDSSMNNWKDSLPEHRRLYPVSDFPRRLTLICCSSMGSKPTELHVLQSISIALCNLLLYSDTDPQTILTSEFAIVAPILRDMYCCR